MTAGSYTRLVGAHYGTSNLAGRIASGLKAAGKHEGVLTPADLAALDQFHTGGLGATMELAQLADLSAGSEVLDVGGGIGGAARSLATAYAARVTVLDLSEPFCEVGEMLTERAGLGDRVRFQAGDGLAPPFSSGSFDYVWMQHSTMNIPDKARLFAEMRRVLCPGGRLALHEITAGPVQPVHFPEPWARDPATSFLVPSDELREMILRAGFQQVAWRDETAAALDWFRARVGKPPSNPEPLGLHLLLGDVSAAAFRNLLRSLEEGRVEVVQGVFESAGRDVEKKRAGAIRPGPAFAAVAYRFTSCQVV